MKVSKLALIELLDMGRLQQLLDERFSSKASKGQLGALVSEMNHTAIDNLKKGFKDTDLGKHGAKRVDNLAKNLIRQGWIIPKPTSYGLQVSLNPRESESITSFMKRYFFEAL